MKTLPKQKLPVITNEAKRVPQRQKRDHLEWLHTARFIEEVHRLEGEGRVRARRELEDKLLLPYNSITTMRRGKLRVPTSAIELLKREYNGDFQFILLGVRDVERSDWFRGGRDLRQFDPYTYAYQSEAVDLHLLAGLPVLPKE